MHLDNQIRSRTIVAGIAALPCFYCHVPKMTAERYRDRPAPPLYIGLRLPLQRLNLISIRDYSAVPVCGLVDIVSNHDGGVQECCALCATHESTYQVSRHVSST